MQEGEEWEAEEKEGEEERLIQAGTKTRGGVTYPHDLGVTLGTKWGKKLFITPFTVNVILLLHKPHVY